MLRVIHISHQPMPYGIGTFLINLLQCQKNRFPDLIVAIAFHAHGPLMATYQGIGLPVHCLELSSARDPRVFTRLLRIFRDYDIVNLHSYSPWAFLAAKSAGKKVVLTFHGTLGIRRGRLSLMRRIYLRNILARHCDKITFASASSLSKFENAVGRKGEHARMEVFPYGISIHGLASAKGRESIRRELGLADCFVVGTAARICPIKRIERLIDAFSVLPRENALKLVIMGAGDDAYEATLREQVHLHNLNDQVLFLGYRGDAIDVIGALDVFALPTGAPGEAFGIALLEAMSLGVPSIVFADGGGAVEIIGDSSFIVKDTSELCDVILRLKADAVLRESVARRVKKRSKLFDIEHTADHFHRIYTSLV